LALSQNKVFLSAIDAWGISQSMGDNT